MLPRATAARNPRDISKLKLSGRSQEIQRLIGRALRSVVNLNLLGERGDADTLLIKVEQVEAACHTGHYSCFYREISGMN